MLGLGGGMAFAQVDQTAENFYADPVLPDPSPVPAQVFAPALATADVAAVSPAAGTQKPQRMTACTAANPCAVTSPLARG